jgi:hypothetical protein
VHARFIDEPDLKIARINTSFVEGRLLYGHALPHRHPRRYRALR